MPNPHVEAGEASGLSIRAIRANGEGEYTIIASTASSADTSFQLWGWDGEPEDEPVLLNESLPLIAEGVWGAITSTPEPIRNTSEVEVLQDNGKTVWYGSGTKDAEKGLIAGLQKRLGRLVTVHIPPPGTPNPPKLVSGGNPNKGNFTLKWKPAPTLRARFTLQHQNAKGGWTTVASNLSKREYTFKPEAEGTWTYRVKESNETAESGYSSESEAIKVDQTAPLTPTVHTEPGSPFYAGNGGWFKDTVTVSFTSNGDPNLADGSPGSGVEPSSLTPPETFNTSGSFKKCGTVADNVGNVSEKACITVQVDATPPTLEISCPATAVLGENVSATVKARRRAVWPRSGPERDGPSTPPKPVRFTMTRTAIDNVGHETTKSCTTEVVYPTPGAPQLASAPTRTTGTSS